MPKGVWSFGILLNYKNVKLTCINVTGLETAPEEKKTAVEAAAVGDAAVEDGKAEPGNEDPEEAWETEEPNR